MSFVHPAVAVRRLFARRPALYWLCVVSTAAVVGLSVQREIDALRDARAGWADTASVLVAVADVDIGEVPPVERIELPVAAVPDSAATSLDRRPARQHIDAGSVITETDLARRSGALALVPAGWRAVPVVESPASLALIGDRVDIVADGVVIVDGGIVVDGDGSTTLVAAPADAAPIVALAAQTSSVTLLRLP